MSLSPEREAEEQGRRLDMAIADCVDRPRSTAKRMIETQEDRDFWRARAQRLEEQCGKYAAQVLELITKGNANVPPTL